MLTICERREPEARCVPTPINLVLDHREYVSSPVLRVLKVTIAYDEGIDGDAIEQYLDADAPSGFVFASKLDRNLEVTLVVNLDVVRDFVRGVRSFRICVLRKWPAVDSDFSTEAWMAREFIHFCHSV
jgi:hypothetical protein